jgi:hypothetical protein
VTLLLLFYFRSLSLLLSLCPFPLYAGAGGDNVGTGGTVFITSSNSVSIDQGFASIGTTGGGGAHNVIQPSQVVQYIIKT